MKALKESGNFEFNHHLPTKGGYHELDIEAFRNRLLSRVQAQMPLKNGANGHVVFKTVMCGHHDAPEIKLVLVEAILDGDLAIVGNIDGTIPGLIIDGPDYRRVASAARSRVAGETMPAYIVEKELHCDTSTVPGLVQMGLLEGHVAPTGLRITNGSVSEFQSRYVSLASIAKLVGSSSRRLMRICSEKGIKMLKVPRVGRDGAQPFIKVSDRSKLVKAT